MVEEVKPVSSGGYYLKAKCIQRSEIMKRPPYVREVWDWLLMNANYRDRKSSGVIIKRGQIFTRLDDIREGLSWYVGYRKESYTKDHMKKAMKALKKASMITTSVSTRGMTITICNYDKYQDPKNYESTNESANENTNEAPMEHQTSATITNELKEYNEFKEIFKRFRASYPLNKRGFGSVKDAELKLQIALKKDTFENIMQGAKDYETYIKHTGQSNKDAFRWLEKEGWRDDYSIQSYEQPTQKNKSKHERAKEALGL